MSEDKENIGVGSALLLTVGGLGLTSLICGTAAQCAEEKTERRRISLKETKIYCRSQERIEAMKLRHRRNRDED